MKKRRGIFKVACVPISIFKNESLDLHRLVRGSDLQESVIIQTAWILNVECSIACGALEYRIEKKRGFT